MSKEKDLTGQKIGKLTVLRRKRKDNRTYYYCRCDCGNELWIRADSLKTTKSCSCLSEETQFQAKDIADKKFGRLTALSPTDERDEDNGSIIWKCRCECNNICFVSATDLIRNRIKSCGCLGKENSQNNMQKAIKKYIEDNIIENTNIQMISRKETLSNNTSGCTGVMWDKRRNRWKSVIEFQKKRYYLGSYKDKKDAIKVRK